MTVEDDQESEKDRGEASAQSMIPSAPPNPCSTRVWTETGENSDTTLLHTAPKRPSKKRSPTITSPSRGCGATSPHTPSKRPLQPSPRSPDARRRQSSGLIVRGSTYYLRLRVPRSLAGIVGKTEVMKSLGTGYRADAVRKARIVAAAFEQQWRDIEAHGTQQLVPATPERPRLAPTPPASPADKTLRQAFWVPLIALFSGMRMNEICQLHVADIHRLDGVDMRRSGSGCSPGWPHASLIQRTGRSAHRGLPRGRRGCG